MPSKVKARLSKIENEFYLELPNDKIKRLELDDVRHFLFNYSDPAYLSNDTSRIVARAKGEVMAKVLDTGSLVILSSNLLLEIFPSQQDIKYLSVSEYSALHGRKSNIVTRLCREGRLPGAIKKGRAWLIPEGTPYPKYTFKDK